MGRDGDLELIEQLLLLGRGLRYTSKADLATVGRRQDDVRALQSSEERQGPRGCEARPATVEQMFQRHPERVPEEGDQDVGLRAHRATRAGLR